MRLRGTSAADAQDNPYGEGDPALAMLVAAAARNDGELGVTLTVPGGVVTGLLIGVNRYWREYEAAGRSAGDEMSGMMRGFFTLPDKGEDEEEMPGLVWRHIHLRDARFVTGGVESPANGMLWRGRLGHVSGWSIGVMRAQIPDA